MIRSIFLESLWNIAVIEILFPGLAVCGVFLGDGEMKSFELYRTHMFAIIMHILVFVEMYYNIRFKR